MLCHLLVNNLCFFLSSAYQTDINSTTGQENRRAQVTLLIFNYPPQNFSTTGNSHTHLIHF